MSTLFNKTDWLTITFGDISELITETCKNPKAEGLERYVGLEHLTPGDLHIQSWGNISDGTTFTRRFSKGDVLFGRRRSYQKKAAVAEFDGICSGDILVFRAKQAVLLPELLPFIVQNDTFFEYAVKTSAGSLSPRTKFKDLQKQKITIPKDPLTQEKILKLFQLSDTQAEGLKSVCTKLEVLFSSVLSQRTLQNSESQSLKLSDIIIDKPQYGANEKASTYVDNGPRYVRITDINKDGDLREDTFAGIAGNNFEKYILENNDLLIARSADPGRSFLYESKYKSCVFAGYLIRFRLNPSVVVPRYVYLFTRTLDYWNQIKRLNKKGTLSNINAQQFLSLNITIPNLEDQRSIVLELDGILSVTKKVNRQLEELMSIQKVLAKKVFREQI